MAKITLDILDTLTLEHHSIYKMQGCKHLVIRRKAGPTKSMIMEGPKFKRVRSNNQEFSGAAKAANKIKEALTGVKHLSNFSLSGRFTAMSLKILKMDKIHVHGNRSILFTKKPNMFKGFNLNATVAFDSVFNNQVTCTLNREQGAAKIFIPELLPSINFFIPWEYPHYRLIMVIGVVPNMVRKNKIYDSVVPGRIYKPGIITTAWENSKDIRAEQSYDLVLPEGTILDASCTVLISIGIEMGEYESGNNIEALKKVGCAKILLQG